MQPLRLQIEDFCSHHRSDIDFTDISSALIVAKINGSDKFSNGAGKSTIFSAIKYALFNKVDFSTLDKVIRHGTDYCKVIFDFKSSNDGEIYRISRITGKKNISEVRLFKKQENDKWEDLTQRRNFDTKKEIAKIIKINYDTFCNSVLFSQSDLTGLASLSPTNRKKILKSALQLDIYSKYEKLAKKKTADLLKEMDKEKTILSTIGKPEEDIEKYNKEIDNISKNIDNKSIILNEIKIEYNKENISYISLIKEFEEIKIKKDESLNKQKLLNEEINNITNILNEYNKKNENILSSGKSLSLEIKEINNYLEKNDIKNIKSKEELKNNISDITQLISDKKAKYKSLQVEMEDLKVPMPKGSSCKYCRQEISDEARNSCQKSIDEKIKNINENFFSLQKEIKELDLQLSINKKEIDNLDILQQNITNKKTSLIIKEKDIENKRKLLEEYSEIIKRNNDRLKEKKKELLSSSISNIENEGYSLIKNNIILFKNKVSLLSDKIEIVNKEIVSLSNLKAVLFSKIEDRTKDLNKITDLNITIEKLSKQYIIHQKVVQAFSSTGIPALITHTILDDFQLETNNYLIQLKPGLQLQFSVIKDRDDGDEEDTLNIDFILNGIKLEFQQLSGAQKLLTSLSLKLGLASVIKKRLGVEINFLMIDEVDQSLDEGGLEAFEEAIRKLEKDFKVLVITHNNDLKNNFSTAILVEQDQNLISTAKTVNNW